MIEIFGLLVFGHMLADYPLQGQFLSVAKNRHNPLCGVPWEQGLLAHCVIHAGFVGIITGSIWLALIELVAHAIIDDTKCANRLSFRQDQALHIGCKALWCAILLAVQ